MRVKDRWFWEPAVICLLSLLGTAIASAQPIGLMSPQAPQKPQPNVLCAAGGRFVFGQVSDSSKDQFMLDTWTGRLWRISESGGVGLFLNPVPYRIKDGKYEPLPDAASEPGRKEGGRK
ncbi:MAG: hypothetical protein JXL84_06865 [Deltaproteobacteria bacterium]|nr:hypothetical protein [Deltaproteobacteria bacterium]